MTSNLKVCFQDGYYTYKFADLQMTGVDTYYGVGNSDAYGGSRVTLWLDLTKGISSGQMEMHVINPNPDGCNFYNDSFVYTGAAMVVKNGSISYSGNGNWTSYCFGSVLFTGTWYAQGPCGKSFAPKPGTKPTDTKKNADNNALKISPNPAKDYTHIAYKISSQAKVNITIYDINGLTVKTLVNESKAAGAYNISWNMLNKNGTKVSPGIYKVTAIVDGKILTGNLQAL
ncbi:MAG TPA: FlgD immunoglobulin-like domain containing protein [Panacibacter sp.]|nr:FlgD immunoglobulin-like domain containing protein [Panacibacter sp.]HNP44374.1 FlgD immunoglobulin-like domain containing protein [Panacibacter sp.]